MNAPIPPLSLARTALCLLHPARWTALARNSALWLRCSLSAPASATWHRLFSPHQYLALHPDVARSGIHPLPHFLIYGNLERRDPSPRFDTAFYLARNPDVARSGVNALLHFALFGQSEGRTLNSHTSPIPPPSAGALTIENSWPAGIPILSVVIPCYNYGSFVEQAIRSVLAQTWDQAEVLVVDGGSSDPATIAELRRLEALNLPGVLFFFRHHRHLAGDNRNFGIARARGRYIVCLDADDHLDPIALETALFLAESAGLDLVFSSALAFGASDALWRVSTPTLSSICIKNQVSTSALFRRSAWAHAGGFRDFGLAADHVPEDWDFWLRLLAHGATAQAIEEPLLHYRVHAASLSASASLAPHLQRDRILAANAGLIHSAPSCPPAPRLVSNPFINVSSPVTGPRPAFLLALPFITHGGAESLLLSLALHMAGRGFRLILVTTSRPGPGVADLHRHFRSLTPHLYPLATLFDNPTASSDFLLHLILRYRVSSLLFAGADEIYALLPSLKHDYPNLFIADQLFNEQAFASINRHYRAHIDTTIVPSQSLKSALEQLTPDSPGRIEIIPHAIHVPPQSEPRPASAIPHRSFTVAFFGRLAPGKGALDFIALARALAADPRYHFILAGDGPERPQALAEIDRASLHSRFLAPGFVPPSDGLMDTADVLIVPSRVDGMPLVILEAQARSIPVVASAVGSIPTMIQDGQTGFLCPPGDIDLFKRRVELLAADPALRASIGAASRRFVIDHYSEAQMLDSYARLFTA